MSDLKNIQTAPSTRQMKNIMKDHEKLIQPVGFRGMPSIVKTEGNSRYSMDPFSSMLQARTVFYTGGVDEVTSELARVQLLYLAQENPEKDIYLYVDSEGGQVYRGEALIDVMHYIPCDVVTVATGMAMSMGAQTLINGTPGKRYSLPNSRIMIHQPLGGKQGQASDIELGANEINALKAKLTLDVSKLSGVSFEEALIEMDRDNFLSPREALEFGDKGIIDGILVNQTVVHPSSENGKVKTETTIIRRGDERLDEYCPRVDSYIDMVKKFASDNDFKNEVFSKAKAAKEKRQKS